MSAPLKVLYVCQSHPDIRPAGSEIHAQELYAAMRARGDVETFLLARDGPPYSVTPRPHEGTLTSVLPGGDGHQYLFHYDARDFRHFFGLAPEKEHLTVFLDRFLRELQPDVVHLHQTTFLGYDILRQIRNSVPHAVLVHTLHDFLPICARDGQMLRRGDHERCLQASCRRCHECIPDTAPAEFFLRERFIKAQLEHVDVFLCPSRFLLERYAAWGLPREKLRHEPYGRATPASQVLPRRHDGGPRWRFGFFGQLTHYKGVFTLLEAMRHLDAASGGAARLWLHGNNIDLQTPEFRRMLGHLLDELHPAVTQAGPYQRGELRALMENVDWVVVPSLWWENLPLVIQEAYQCGRPVICGNVGGMAEAVIDGVSGLHFHTGQAVSLAETMQRAATTPGLWEQLRRGLPAVPTVEAQAERLVALYREVLEGRHVLA